LIFARAVGAATSSASR